MKAVGLLHNIIIDISNIPLSCFFSRQKSPCVFSLPLYNRCSVPFISLAAVPSTLLCSVLLRTGPRTACTIQYISRLKWCNTVIFLFPTSFPNSLNILFAYFDLTEYWTDLFIKFLINTATCFFPEWSQLAQNLPLGPYCFFPQCKLLCITIKFYLFYHSGSQNAAVLLHLLTHILFLLFWEML